MVDMLQLADWADLEERMTGKHEPLGMPEQGRAH